MYSHYGNRFGKSERRKLTGQERTDAEDLLCRTALEGIYHYHMKMGRGEKNEQLKILPIGSETVIGMVHCLPLPTTAGFDGDYQKILDRAVADANMSLWKKQEWMQ
ncbi:MAG: hypothetical protein ACLVC1_05175 [Mediterraneibacter gnavus]